MADSHEYIEDILTDLIGRMETAEVHLVDMAEEATPSSDRQKRLESKAHGVALARSYVAKELRRQRAQQREAVHRG